MGIPKNELFVKIDTSIKQPVISLENEKNFDKSSIKIALILITLQAITIGITISIEKLSFVLEVKSSLEVKYKLQIDLKL